jgi:hypothetical protein
VLRADRTLSRSHELVEVQKTEKSGASHGDCDDTVFAFLESRLGCQDTSFPNGGVESNDLLDVLSSWLSTEWEVAACRNRIWCNERGY